MRRLRPAAALIALATVLALPTSAGADGGAYIQLDRTHYRPGSTATGEAYVSIPVPQQRLLDEGPFYVWVLPPKSWIEPGEPIPADAIRAGTVTVEHVKGREVELGMSFVVPDLPGDYYDVAMCDDPCTVAGFREPLTAQVSIVATAREAELLNENARLYARTWALRRQARKAERQNQELAARVAADGERIAELTVQVEALEGRPTVETRQAEEPTGRPLVNAWALVALAGAAIAALLAIGLAVAFGRRAPRLEVPATG